MRSPENNSNLQRTPEVDRTELGMQTSSPDVLTEQDFMQTVYNGVRLDAQGTAEAAEVLSQSMEVVRSNCTTDYDHFVADGLEELLHINFIQPAYGAELPDTMVYYESSGRQKVGYDLRKLPYFYIDDVSTMARLVLSDQDQFQDLCARYRSQFKQHSGAMTESVRIAIEQSEVYQKIRQFFTPEFTSTDEQPLSYDAWLIRAAQVEEGIKREFGIPASTTIVNGTRAGIELRSRLARLDNEVERADAQDNDTPYSKMLDYLEAQLRQQHEYINARVVLSNNEVRVVDDGIFGLLPHTFDKKLQSDLVGDSSCKYLGIDSLLAEQFVFDLSYSTFPDDPQQYINNLVGGVIGKLFGELNKLRNRYITTDTLLPKLIGMHGLLLSSEQYDLITKNARSYADTEGSPKLSFTNEAAWYTTEDRYREDLQKNVARVHCYPRAELDHRIRLILSGGPSIAHQTLSAIDNENKATYFGLLVYSKFGEANIPVIPGFVLQDNRKYPGNFQYTKDPNGDPYDPALIELESEDLTKLADEYESIGLHTLADAVREQTDTVQDLVKHIRSSSTYVFEKPYDGEEVSNRKEICDFKQLVIEGELYVQCTGAASFLKKSLLHFFDESELQILHGHTMTIDRNSPKVDGVAHEQVQLTAGGKRYMLDSTPGYDGPLDIPSGVHNDFAASDTGFGGQSVGEYVAPQYDLQLPDDQEVVTTKQEEDPMQTMLNSVEASLSLLENYFGAQNRSHMYEQAAELSKYDPVRRAIAAFIHIQKDKQIDVSELEALQNSIRLYIDADDATRKRARLPQHDTTLLNHIHRSFTTVKNCLTS